MKDLTPKKSDLDPIEIASRDEIMALQLTRMKTTLKHAYDNVPMYKDRFDAAGVHPDDLTCLSDLAKFPFTYKDDLRANYPFGLSAVPREELVRIHASSGTTGKPTVVVYTQNDIDVWAEVVARSLRAWPQAWRYSAQRLWLRPFHRWAWRTLRDRAAWRDSGSHGGRANRKAGGPHHRF